jgi:hypothetical protein
LRFDTDLQRQVRDLAASCWKGGHADSPHDIAEDIQQAAESWLGQVLEDAPVCRHRSPYCQCPDWLPRTGAGYV